MATKRKIKAPNAPKIQSTMNYERFKFYKHNRKVIPSNVKNLIEENKRCFNMHNFPIVVNDKNEIVDGQHRFEACRINEWPVYYVVQKQRLRNKVLEIMTVNRAGKRHNTQDVIRMNARTGNAAAKKVLEVARETPLTASQVATLLSYGCEGRGDSVRSALGSGTFTIKPSNLTVLNRIIQTVDDSKLSEINKSLGGTYTAIYKTFADCDTTIDEIVDAMVEHEKDLTFPKSNLLKNQVQMLMGFA